MADNRTHYLPTAGIPPLRKAFAEKMRKKNHIPVGSDDEIMVTNGGTHGLYAVFHALLEPGDEVIVPEPGVAADDGDRPGGGRQVPVQVPLREELGWRWNIDEVEQAITPKTRVLYLNSPNNPSGGVLTRADLERLAAIAQRAQPVGGLGRGLRGRGLQRRAHQHRVAAGHVRPHHSGLHA